MQTVKTSRFGDIKVEPTETIELPRGIIGFPELKNYILLDHDKDSPFKWLQSVDDGEIAFVLINPLLFRPDYSIEVTESEVDDLDLKSEEDAVISVIVTIPGTPENMTANLKAPLVFNLKNRKGKQIILNTSTFTTRHNILEEMRRYSAQKEQETRQEAIQAEKDGVAGKVQKEVTK